MKIRRRLFWAINDNTLKSFGNRAARDEWIGTHNLWRAINANHPAVRKANRSFAFNDPCEIELTK